MTRWSHHVLPSGLVFSVPMPELEVSFGTYLRPVEFIPLRSDEEIAADERRQAVAMVLAVFREHGIDPSTPKPAGPAQPPGRMRRLMRDHRPFFADLGPIGFDYELPAREPSRCDFYGLIPPAYPVLPLSGII